MLIFSFNVSYISRGILLFTFKDNVKCLHDAMWFTRFFFFVIFFNGLTIKFSLYRSDLFLMWKSNEMKFDLYVLMEWYLSKEELWNELCAWLIVYMKSCHRQFILYFNIIFWLLAQQIKVVPFFLSIDDTKREKKEERKKGFHLYAMKLFAFFFTFFFLLFSLCLFRFSKIIYLLCVRLVNIRPSTSGFVVMFYILCIHSILFRS
jgi:hypothetical protein